MSDTPPDLTPEQVSPEPAPKKRIIRKTKSAAEAPVKPQTAAEVSGTEQDSSPAPRKRTIRKKAVELADDGMESVDVPGKKTSRKSGAEIPVEEAQEVPARPRRGRPRKKPVEEVRKLTALRSSPERRPPSSRCAGVLPRLLLRRTVIQPAPRRKLPFMRRLPSRLPILFRNSPQKAGRRLFARDL